MTGPITDNSDGSDPEHNFYTFADGFLSGLAAGVAAAFCVMTVIAYFARHV